MGTVKFELEIEESALKALKKFMGTVQRGNKVFVKKISGEYSIKELFYIGKYYGDLDLTDKIKVKRI